MKRLVIAGLSHCVAAWLADRRLSICRLAPRHAREAGRRHRRGRLSRSSLRRRLEPGGGETACPEPNRAARRRAAAAEGGRQPRSAAQHARHAGVGTDAVRDARATPRPRSAYRARPQPDPEPAYREVTFPPARCCRSTCGRRSGPTPAASRTRCAPRCAARSRSAASRRCPQAPCVTGHVTEAARSAKVKGRARIAFRFTRSTCRATADGRTIRTATVARLAPATKKDDAAKIGGGAAGGAIIGGIIGGGDGAAKGAAIGGAAAQASCSPRAARKCACRRHADLASSSPHR